MIVSVMGFKGGVGKTTLATTIAAGCARAGKRTLLVECDGQGNSSQSMGITPFNGFYELLHGAPLEQVIVDVPTAYHEQGELYLLSTFNWQSEVEKDPQTPARIIERFADLRAWFDVIVVDTSPGNTEVHAGLFYASDYLIMPTICAELALNSLVTTLAYRDNAEAEAVGTAYRAAPLLGIVPNLFHAREDVEQSNLKILHEDYDGRYRVFDPIRDLTAWRGASQLHQSIFAYSALSTSGNQSVRRARRDVQPVLDAVLQAADKPEVYS